MANLQDFFILKERPIESQIEWCQRWGLLANPLFCGDCRQEMRLVKKTENKVDGHAWRCAGCKKKRSLRCNSFFGTIPKVQLTDGLLMLYFWSKDESRKKTAIHVGVSQNLVSKFFRTLGNICSENIRRYPFVPFGGPGHIVQCDESKFNHKAKYERGRRAKDLWVFGVITSEFQPCRGYYQVVHKRDRPTLLSILDKCLKAGSLVHTDDWGAYIDMEHHLPQKVAAHEVVNHSLYFVDPVTGVHTQNIEAKWNSLKRGIKERKGVDRDGLQIYLDERMWREWRGGTDVFDNVITALCLAFPNVSV